MLILITDIDGDEIIVGLRHIANVGPVCEQDDPNNIKYIISYIGGGFNIINQHGWDQLKKACVNYDK